MIKKITYLIFFISLIGCGGSGGGASKASPTFSNSITNSSSSQISPSNSTLDFDAEKFQFEESSEYKSQYGLSLIKSSSAYARGATGEGVLIGIMDTGVDYLHQELNGVDKFQTIYTTYDENSPPSTDEKRHGTHVAAIIAGEKEGSGMHGVAFGSKILFIEIKLGTASETYEPAEINPSIDYTGYDNFHSYYEGVFINEGVDVVNGSFGFQGNIIDYSEENLRYAFPKTINVMAQPNILDKDKTIFVWSAGNAGAYADQGVDFSNPEVFAGMPYMINELKGHTIAVVSLDESGEISSFSSRCGVSKDYCIAAPGRFINSAYSQDPPVNDEYRSFSGTSMAAPHVTGGIALLVDYFNDQLGNTEIVDRLFKTANKSGIYSDSSIYGQGLLDLDAATKPVGQMMAATTSSLDNYLIPKKNSFISFTGLLGNSLLDSFTDRRIVFFDELGAPFSSSLTSIMINKRPSIRWLSSYYSRPLNRGKKIIKNISPSMDFSISYLNQLHEERYLGPTLWTQNNSNLEAFSLLKRLSNSSFLFAGYGKNPSEYFSNPLLNNFSNLEDLSSPYLMFTSEGSFFGGGFDLTETSALKLAFLDGKPKLDEHFYEGPEAFGYIAEYTKIIENLSFSIVSGVISEKNGILGNSFSGAFETEGFGNTYFEGITFSADLFGYHFMSSVYTGKTKNNFSDLSLIHSISDVESDAYSFGIHKTNFLVRNDSLKLYFSQPLSINEGSLLLNIPIARTKSKEVIFEEVELNLTPTKKEKTFELSYQIDKQEYSIASRLKFIEDNHFSSDLSKRYFFDITWEIKLN